MYVRIENGDVRTRVVSYLRSQGYLAMEEREGVFAQPLNTITDRYDRVALTRVLQDFERSEGVELDAHILSSEEWRWRPSDPGSTL
jgi:hypothetical protein